MGVSLRPNGRQREMGLGPAGKGGVLLSKARDLAAAARQQLRDHAAPIRPLKPTVQDIQSYSSNRLAGLPLSSNLENIGTDLTSAIRNNSRLRAFSP
jgi:hypothetical protein